MDASASQANASFVQVPHNRSGLSGSFRKLPGRPPDTEVTQVYWGPLGFIDYSNVLRSAFVVKHYFRTFVALRVVIVPFSTEESFMHCSIMFALYCINL